MASPHCLVSHLLWILLPAVVICEVLTPPYFNLAENRRITATATCGHDVPQAELYCKLVGANADRDVNYNLIQGQVCCDLIVTLFAEIAHENYTKY